jgi:hypothetical protein
MTTPSLIGVDLRINAGAAGTQFNVDAIPLTGGGGVFFWTTGSDLYARTLSSTGGASGDLYLASQVQRAGVTPLSDGGFALAAQGATNLDTSAYDANGSFRTTSVNYFTGAQSESPVFALNRQGAIVLFRATDEDDGPYNGLDILDNRGSPVGDHDEDGVVLNNGRRNSEKDVDGRLYNIVEGVGLSNGNSAIATVTRASEGRENAIFLHTVDGGLNDITGPVRLAGGGGVAPDTVDLIALGSGFMATWTDGNSVNARWFDASGRAAGGTFTHQTVGAAADPSAIALSDGSVFIAWSDLVVDTREIIGRHVAADGTPLGNVVLVNNTVAGDQTHPNGFQLSNGDVYVSWTDGASGDVEGRIVSFTRPDATNDTVRVIAGEATRLDLTGNDRDPNGDAFQVRSAEGATNGTVTVDNGVVTYVPRAGFTGADSFNYTIADGNGGTDTARAFVTVAQKGQTPNDFDGDGHSDILWRNINGSVSTWAVRGDGRADQVQQGVFNGGASPSWTILETLDRNGDGRADILWQNSDGALSIWDAREGGGFSEGAYYHGAVGGGWRIAGTGDLNGDGRHDLLWQNVDGAVSAWRSTDGGFEENSYFHGSVGASWRLVGLGDFTGDGRADILWRNTDGSLATWAASGPGVGFSEGGYFAGGVPTSWHIDGIGDFSGDGRDDLIWRNDNGGVSVWRSNGGGFDQGVFNTSVGTEWQIAQVADFNGDGRADILWRAGNGALTTWQSNGGGFDQSVYNSSVPTDWTIMDHVFPL